MKKERKVLDKYLDRKIKECKAVDYGIITFTGNNGDNISVDFSMNSENPY